ncbi:MOSC domain-containing protein [Paenibacillus athensensis]|uniref:MOSC domain-containing protein n=2 Tax=Paenibacillus athensensis TaxID=1967502 RepID=A0A4Y8PY57_9BACL|nr:MOSC domain-containing protein [Paenibacillus athensensis]MCD1259353.1 MOSC domain-containing protein [Paenibacillus athensensis]
MTTDAASFVTARQPHIAVELAGIPGDRHYGLLRPADSRQTIYRRGTLIANRRQISVVSAEECALIAARLGIPHVLPEWLGANLALSGLADLTQLPRGARLLFPDGTGLVCEGDNPPCIGPGRVVEAQSGVPGLSQRFVRAAGGRRGIVCSVEREGVIAEGDLVSIVFDGVPQPARE